MTSMKNGIAVRNGRVLTADGLIETDVLIDDDRVTSLGGSFDAEQTIDAAGALWVAMYGGWSVRRYWPDGRLDREIRLPVAKVTSCAFGGDALDVLYITTAGSGLDDEERSMQPHAGALFGCMPGETGIAEAPFAG